MKILSGITSIAEQALSSIIQIQTKTLWIVGIALTLLQQGLMAYLGKLYTATGFPVPFSVGQTAFDGNLIKSYYAVLIEKGTLDDYYFVQTFDYVFMVSVFLAHLFMSAAIYKSLPPIKWLKAFGFAMIVITPFAAVFDALENLVSFIMLANPLDFANYLAYPYSSFAVIKFALFALFTIWAIFAIVVIFISNIRKRLNKQ